VNVGVDRAIHGGGEPAQTVKNPADSIQKDLIGREFLMPR
jgi:hypothetical protein